MTQSVHKFFKNPIVTGEIEGQVYFIVNSPSSFGGYNGYALFDKCPTIETGYNGILTYVPVHGGITFVEYFKEGVVYGFDTAHYNSEQFPRHDLEWIKGQIAVMIRGIRQAAKVEKKYLVAKKNETRAKYAQSVQDVDTSGGDTWNMGVALNLLSGQI